MYVFLQCLAKPVLKFAVRAAGNGLGMGVPVGDWAVEVWEGYARREDGRRLRAEIEQIAQDQREWKRQVEEAVRTLAADLPAEVQRLVAGYLNQVPAGIQRSLRRPEDPSGRTLPDDLPLGSPADLQRFIPGRMPSFRPGDCPVAGTDLVLEELVGVGGFGEVWRATHRGRPHAPPVALKFCTDPAAARSLQREVELLDRVAARGRHPNIVELKYAHLSADPVCLEYEYVAGGDLAGYVSNLYGLGRATPERVARVLLQLADAVGFAHDQQPPIVHRDLKPPNVLAHRADDGKVILKVADFGIGGVAADREAERRDTARASGATTSPGSYTPMYASPQQRKGRPADPRDDVYALGVIWYQMAAGNFAAEAPRGGEWKRRLADRGMPAGMVGLLERCVEDAPADRPPTARHLADELAERLDEGHHRHGLTSPAGRRPDRADTRRAARGVETPAPDQGTLQVVRGPAYGLIACGLLGGAFSLLGVFVSAVTAAQQPTKPGSAVDGQFLPLFWLTFCIAGGLTAYGGHQMLKLRRFPWAIAGSIAAVVGPCGCLGVSLPVGIWALAVLLKPNVRSAFR